MLRRIILIILSIFFIAFLSLSVYISLDMRDWEIFDPDKLENLNQSTILYDRENSKITDIHGVQNRISISIDELPKHVPDAFVAVEDVRFFRHRGIDIRRMVGALFQNIKSRRYAEGASTITQQVVRNSHLTMKKTMSRKLQEIYLALILDRQYSKNEILQTYLNIIYFGEGAYGIETASNIYFNKSAKDLTLAEAAVLASIPKSPSKFSPFANEEEVLKRKDLILDLMVENEFLSAKEGALAKDEPIVFEKENRANNSGIRFGYLVDKIMEDAKGYLDISDEDLYTGGYRIYTTVDSQIQEMSEKVLANDDYFPKSPNSGNRPEAALIAIHPETGEILALMGGREYPKDQRKVLNRATQSKRQPGSAIKPIISFAPAIENFGYTAATVLDDSPVDIGGYSPQNYGGGYRGLVTVREALAHSINTIAVKVLYDIGIDNGVDFAKNLGIPIEPQDENNLSIALGGFHDGITLLELSRAYACLADEGIYKELSLIRRIEDSRGIALYENTPIKRNAVSQETAFLINSMLQSAVEWGTGKSLLELGIPIAAKTGTSQLPKIEEFRNLDGTRDAWVVAYNPELVLGIWVGFDRTTRSDYLPSSAVGGAHPARIAREILASHYSNRTAPAFLKPQTIVEAELDSKSIKELGKLALANSLTPDEYIYREFFTIQTLPTATTEYWEIPEAPTDFQVYSEGLTAPMIQFTTSSTRGVYEIHRVDMDTDEHSVLHRVESPVNEAIVWFDDTVRDGGRYRYYVVASHPELMIGAHPLQGQATEAVEVIIPANQ